MGTLNDVKARAVAVDPLSSLPPNFLNAYEVENAGDLSWAVNLYRVDLIDCGLQHGENRSASKNLIWEMRKKYKSLCRGYGFVVDLSPRLVAVPQSWQLPTPITTAEYSIRLERTFLAQATNSEHRLVVAGILREGIKAHFKNNSSEDLGNLWQNFNSFCQYPSSFGDEFLNCRRFGFGAKVLRGGRWVLRLSVGTITLDGRTLKDYYDEGNVELLAGRLESKRGERFTRDNKPTAIRVLQQGTGEGSPFRCVDFEDLDLILRHARLSRSDQKALAASTVTCKNFGGPSNKIPLSELRLFLNSEITQQEHAETIIEPDERQVLTHQLRQFVHGADVSGHSLHLSNTPVDIGSLETHFVLPPPICVKGQDGKPEIVLPPNDATESGLRSRAQKRFTNIKRNGFLVQRPINPVLAWPTRAGELAGRRMKNDLEFLCETQGLPVRFSLVTYTDVEELARNVDRSGFDSVFAVLPETTRDRFTADDTHEKIKRRLQVPSQCLHYDHTLPRRWVDKPARAFRDADPSTAKRVRRIYELCLLNLLVKHHWFPFLPASPFNYNVHIGLDVGGVHNTHAVACLGYGFSAPRDLLIFRPEEIPIEFQKKEPIPTDSLFRGLSSLVDFIASDLRSNGIAPDFETVLFHRDGQLMGDGDSWNEREALKMLHAYCLENGLVSQKSVWTAVEIMKGAEDWRVFRNNGGVQNPLVGQCIFPFDDEQTSLICTTGAPYLGQGTACPIIARIVDIYGQSDKLRVVQDVVWQADLCFTKPDMGMSLPWVLHVADTGALQLSRSYLISGITV
jgi:hypothetical protein